MRWIVSFTLMIGMLGTIFGLAMSGLNPWTSPAEANRINIENEHIQAMNALEESLLVAKTEAEIQKIQHEMEMQAAQYEYDKKALAQDLENRQTAFNTKMQVVTMLGGALSVALIIATFLWVGSKALKNLRSAPVPYQSQGKFIPPVEMIIPNQPEEEFGKPWHEDEFRKSKIKDAREKERAERQQKLDEETALIQRMQSVSDPAKIGNGKYNNLPLAV